MPNIQTLIILAFSATGLLLLGGVATALVARHFRKNIVRQILNNIVDKSLAVEQLELSNPAFHELQRIVQDKKLPVKITVQTLTKRKVAVDLISLEKCNELYSKKEGELLSFIVRRQLGTDIFWADLSAAMSLIAIIIGMFSFLFVSRAASPMDLLAIAITPLLFILMFASVPIVRKIKEKKKSKASREST